MFTDRSRDIRNNPPRLSYGVAVTDFDGDGRPEFVVAGFGAPNLVLDWQDDEVLRDIAPPRIADPGRRAIGVAAGDSDRDGVEELYILNTDTYMGMKRYGDRLFARDAAAPDGWIDLFELPANVENPNLSAGRSVAAIDTDGGGAYRFLVANYAAPVRLHEIDPQLRIRDRAEDLGIRLFTGGRSLCLIPDDRGRPTIIFGNENDGNAAYLREESDEGPMGPSTWVDRAEELGLDDAGAHARGIAVLDTDGDGLLDPVIANWEDAPRLYVRAKPGVQDSPFVDLAPPELATPMRNRTVVAADFDNDGRVELFFNNYGSPNRLFRVHGSTVEELDPGAAAEPDSLGTGAAVADIDGDGVLELLIAHGESQEEPLSLFSVAAAAIGNYLRVAPLTRFGAPARGALVRIYVGDAVQVRSIDNGSGYLCQMEPVAHFGLGEIDAVDAVEVIWPGGTRRQIDNPTINREIEVIP